MKIPKKPRYGYATKMAYQFLVENEVENVPLDPHKIAELMDINIYSYSEVADLGLFSTEELARILSSKDGVSIWKYDNYFIFYNDSPESLGRIRFTIVHEIGHIYLGHFKDFDKTELNRSQLTTGEYDVLENEVNCFARNALAPLPVVMSLPEKNKNVLAELFQISKEAAGARLELLKNDTYYLTGKVLKDMEKRFSNYIFKLHNTSSCLHCGKVHIQKGNNYCYICGSSDLVKIKYIAGVEDKVLYSGINLNSNGRPIICAKCKNETLYNGNYCHICGIFAYNKCTGLYEGEIDQYQQKINWHDHNKGCNKILPGDARFCPECGSTTTFAEDGLLSYWVDESARKEGVVESVPADEEVDLPW